MDHSLQLKPISVPSAITLTACGSTVAFPDCAPPARGHHLLALNSSGQPTATRELLAEPERQGFHDDGTFVVARRTQRQPVSLVPGPDRTLRRAGPNHMKSAYREQCHAC